MTANHKELLALDTAPGAEETRGQELWQGAQGYFLGLVLSALLTALAFFFTGSDWLWGPSIPVALSVLAVAQIGVHLAFFLHLTTAPDSVNNSLALAFGTLIVALVIGGTLWIMYHMNLNMPPMAQMEPMAQMAPPAPGQSRAASGVIEAASPIRVAAKVSGLVRSVDCEAGAHVRQGQLCATIDAPALKQAMTQSESALRTTQARVAQDRAALAAAQARSARRPAAGARVDALRAALSRDERDAASAQQELDAAKARQDDAKIVAPTDGVVLARNIQAGQDVDADAKQLLFLFAPEEAIIAFRVSSPASLGALKPGERVSFTVEELRKQSFDGEVLRIESGHGGGQVVVRAKNPGAALKPGMKASLQTPAE